MSLTSRTHPGMLLNPAFPRSKTRKERSMSRYQIHLAILIMLLVGTTNHADASPANRRYRPVLVDFPSPRLPLGPYQAPERDQSAAVVFGPGRVGLRGWRNRNGRTYRWACRRKRRGRIQQDRPVGLPETKKAPASLPPAAQIPGRFRDGWRCRQGVESCPSYLTGDR